jgi:rhodanese-related sulfurtransferase
MTELKRTLLQFVVLAVTGLAIGLVANALSPKGLSLTTNYFAKRDLAKFNGTRPHNGPAPSGTTQTAPTSRVAASPLTSSATNKRTANHNATQTGTSHSQQMTEDEMVQRLKDLGYQALYHREVVDLFNSPYRTDGLYVVIDARTEQHYQDGHIPGAYHLDHYYLDQTIDKVLEACGIAEKIVVYCNGGDCEDSELAVGDLLEKGIPFDRLYVYAGGFTMWAAEGMRYEIGERNSGEMVQGTATNGRQGAKGTAQ